MDDEILLPRNYMDFAYRPKRRTPLASYMRRLSLHYVYPDNTVLDRQTVPKVYAIYIPFVTKHQRSINLTTFGKTKLSKSTQTFNSIHNLNQEKNRFFYLLSVIILAVIIICSIIIGIIVYIMEKNTMPPAVDNHTLILFKFVNDIKAVRYNQESDIWNNVSLTINKLISRATRKVSLIILLFANETTTMDSLTIALAYASSTVLNTDIPLCLNPDIGDNAGEIRDILKKQFPVKKVVIICDILNINTKIIMALRDLCVRTNPFAGEAIYILTMQTDNYQLSQDKLAFVEKQVYRKLLNNINRDTLIMRL